MTTEATGLKQESSEAIARERAELRKLTTLIESGQLLADTRNLKAAISRVLDTLAQHHRFIRSFVVIHDKETDKLQTEAAHGFTSRHSGFRLGEGIIGQVAKSGKPVVIPKINREPLLQIPFFKQSNSSRSREHSLVCVPIIVNRKSVGVFGAELVYKAERNYDRHIKFMSVIASMIAQALKVEYLIASEKQRLLDENIHLKQELRDKYDFGHIIGTSNPMRQVFEQVTQVARTNTTVILRGESGTGKELIAHAIHYNSHRANAPFVKVSCAAIPETLLEAELFGHEKGAFTGAHGRKKGRFELANGGTLFLDEIGDLSLSTQVKLLRVLQEREFERLGGTETIKVDVRLITATNKDLEKAIKANQFRGDLYYRLNVFSIFIPPLRERKSDILLLAEHFLEKYEHKHGKRIRRISTPAIDMLMSYHWPGNVRELENAIERAVLVCDTNVLHGHHLPPTLQTAEGSDTITRLTLAASVEAYEKDLIQDALKTTRGNKAKTAKLLDTTERIIGYKIKRYGIDCNRFRS
jgi:Nif-specific regulatory protein